MKTLATIATTVALFTLGAMSSAVHADELRTQVVRFTELDVHSAQAARGLYARLKTAAESACSDQLPDSPQLGMDRAYRDCMRSALGRAVLQVNRPLLTLYAAQHGVPAANLMGAIAANH